MQTSYIRYGRRYSIPSTAQILDELKAGYVKDYVPISQGYKKPNHSPKTDSAIDGKPMARTSLVAE